jgi:hypothetical protein
MTLHEGGITRAQRSFETFNYIIVIIMIRDVPYMLSPQWFSIHIANPIGIGSSQKSVPPGGTH